MRRQPLGKRFERRQVVGLRRAIAVSPPFDLAGHIACRPAQLAPEPPGRLVARNTAPGQVTLSWTPPPCCDGLVGDAAAGYKVYHSANGRAFDNGRETTATSLAFEDLSPGSLHFFRVTALNAGGESFPTAVVAARTPAGTEGAPLLVVDGSDRLDQAAMIPARIADQPDPIGQRPSLIHT